MTRSGGNYDRKKIIDEAVRRAQEIGRQYPPEPPCDVAHPENEFSWKLIRIEGEEGVCIRPVGKDSHILKGGKIVGEVEEKRFPIRELFSPRIAAEQAAIIEAEWIKKNRPERWN